MPDHGARPAGVRHRRRLCLLGARSYDDPQNDTIALEQPAVRALLDELPEGPVLDAACGTGRHASYLAGAGHGYTGGGRYVDERAVVDGDLITAGPRSPVQFACAALERLGLASKETLEAYEALFGRGDQAGFRVLMAAGAT